MADTAVERASQVMAAAYTDWWTTFPTHHLTVQDAEVAALMDDPDLLVDLAIEAGGLEDIGQTWPEVGVLHHVELTASPSGKNLHVYVDGVRYAPEADR